MSWERCRLNMRFLFGFCLFVCFLVVFLFFAFVCFLVFVVVVKKNLNKNGYLDRLIRIGPKRLYIL